MRRPEPEVTQGTCAVEVTSTARLNVGSQSNNKSSYVGQLRQSTPAPNFIPCNPLKP